MFKTEQELKSEEIKRAQAERRAQHTEYMIALKNLTKTIIYQISTQGHGTPEEIEEAIGFEHYREDQQAKDLGDGDPILD